MANFSGQYIDDQYVLNFGTTCCQCGKELQTSYLLSTASVAQIVTLGWGPICKRCSWQFWDRLKSVPYPYDDDSEVYA